jgi:4-hydroxy-tetrahydrodipicolinate synthase
MFYETNPIPVKTTLALMGKIKEEFRLPMCQMGKASRDKLVGVIRKYGLIS